jgi:hypothetical protein
MLWGVMSSTGRIAVPNCSKLHSFSLKAVNISMLMSFAWSSGKRGEWLALIPALFAGHLEDLW